MQIPNIEPGGTEQDTIAPIEPNPYWLAFSKLLETDRKIAKELLMRTGLASPQTGILAAASLLGLGRTPETAEKYAYGFPPKPAEGFGRLNQALAPENVELAGLVPQPPGLKTVAGLAAAAKAAPFIGKGIAAGLAGMTKGVEPAINALTKVTPVEDAMAALKNLAHSHVTVADFNEAHPAIAALGPEDKKMVVNMQKNFVDKYNLWGAPEGQAAYFNKGGYDPAHMSFEDYPPGWADKMLKEFESLKGATSPPSAPVPALGPATSKPLAHWHKGGGYYTSKGPATSSFDLQNGWQSPGLLLKGWPAAGTPYAEHTVGAKILHGDKPDTFEVHFPDGTVEGPFASALDAKQYFHDAEAAGMVAPPAPSPALGPAAKQGPQGGGPVPAGQWGNEVPHPDFWAETGSTASGSQVFENKHTGVGIVHDMQTGLYHPTTDSGIPYGSGHNTPKAAGEEYDAAYGASVYPPHLQGAAASDVWMDVPGHVGDHVTHPSGLTIEKHPDTGNFHIKGSDGIMLDWEPTMEKAKETAKNAHVADAWALHGNHPAAVPTPPTPPGWVSSANGGKITHHTGAEVKESAAGGFIATDPNGKMIGAYGSKQEAIQAIMTDLTKPFPAISDLMSQTGLMKHWTISGDGNLTPDVASYPGMAALDKGWSPKFTSEPDNSILMVAHTSGAKIHMQPGSEVTLTLGDGTKVGPFDSSLDAKQFLHEAEKGGILPKAGPGAGPSQATTPTASGKVPPAAGDFSEWSIQKDSTGAVMGAQHSSGTAIAKQSGGWWIGSGANKVGPMPTAEAAMDKYNKYYFNKTNPVVPGSLHSTPEPRGPLDLSDPAVAKLKSSHGLTEDEIRTFHEWEGITPQAMLDRYDEARAMGEKWGLLPGNTIEERQAIWKDQILPDVLSRASKRKNPRPVAPFYAPESSPMKYANTTGNLNTAHKLLFYAGPDSRYSSGGQYSGGGKMEDLRALVRPDELLRPDWIKKNPDAPITHQFEKTYDHLKNQEHAALIQFPIEYHGGGQRRVALFGNETGKEIMDNWRSHGFGAGFNFAERPDISVTLEAMGLKGITTEETGGVNYALIDVPTRWSRAPWDPSRIKTQGYFYGGGAAAGSGLAAYLAAQALQGQQPEPEQ